MNESLRMAINSPVGMFEYILLMSKEANFMRYPCAIFKSSSIIWTVFLTLYVNGNIDILDPLQNFDPFHLFNQSIFLNFVLDSDIET